MHPESGDESEEKPEGEEIQEKPEGEEIQEDNSWNDDDLIDFPREFDEISSILKQKLEKDMSQSEEYPQELANLYEDFRALQKAT